MLRVGAAEVRPMRSEVLRPGLPFEATIWPGDDDDATIHLAAYEGSSDPGPAAVVGVVTLLSAAYPGPGDGRLDGEPALQAAVAAPAAHERAYQLRGMAVRPDRQSGGVGRALVDAGTVILTRAGADLLWCNARLQAAGFYVRAGFAVDGGVYWHPPLDLPHVRMWLALGR